MNLGRLAAIEDIKEGESDPRAEKAPRSVENGIPEGNADVERIDLTEYLGGEDEEQDDRFKKIRQVDIERMLDERGNEQENQGEHAQHHVFVVTEERGANQRHQDEGAQDEVEDEHRGLLFPLSVHDLFRALDETRHDLSFRARAETPRVTTRHARSLMGTKRPNLTVKSREAPRRSCTAAPLRA